MIQAICWTLLHSLWQGLLFAMVTGVVMLLTRRTSAAVRYNLLCGLLLSLLAVCGGTFIYEWSIDGRAVPTDAILLMGEGRVWIAGWLGALGQYCSDHALLIVWIWLFVFAVKSLRMLGGLLYAQRIRHYGVSAAPESWQRRVNEMGVQLSIRKAVQLVESRLVKMPLVTGHWRPMIFMPLGLLSGLPAGEIEAVLLHELAHIRRHDVFINFVQSLAGNILFFNPGFLWISALLRDERENCCDDVAIDRTRDKVQFIRALISFKEYDLRMSKVANGFPSRKRQLVRRVSRIAYNDHQILGTTEKLFLVVSFAMISLLVIAGNGGPGKIDEIAKVDGVRKQDGKGKYDVARKDDRSLKYNGGGNGDEKYNGGGNGGEKDDRSLMDDEGGKLEGVEKKDGVGEDDKSLMDDAIRKQDEMGKYDRVGKDGKNLIDNGGGEKRDEMGKYDGVGRDYRSLKDDRGGKREKAGKNYGVARNDRIMKEDKRIKDDWDMQKDQVEKDREQAKANMLQQAREQTRRDEAGNAQAVKDKDQAERDKQQAVRDREQAERDKQQAERDVQQALRDKAQAERDAHQAALDKQQAAKDVAQAMKDALQAH
jgi:bla regulator protein BlaR1